MADETDGIEEAFEGQLRVLVTAAAKAGEQMARIREDRLRRAQATSEQEARELQSRFAAEQRAARAEFANVYRSGWWDHAKPEQIAHAYELTRAWAHEEPEAVRAEQRIADEVQVRYGTSIDGLLSQVQVEREQARQRLLQEQAANAPLATSQRPLDYAVGGPTRQGDGLAGARLEQFGMVDEVPFDPHPGVVLGQKASVGAGSRPAHRVTLWPRSASRAAVATVARATSLSVRIHGTTAWVVQATLTGGVPRAICEVNECPAVAIATGPLWTGPR